MINKDEWISLEDKKKYDKRYTDKLEYWRKYAKQGHETMRKEREYEKKNKRSQSDI